MNWYKKASGNFDKIENKYTSGHYYFRGTSNIQEVKQIIRTKKMIPSIDTIVGDPVLEQEYGVDSNSAPEWAYTMGVNLTDDYENAKSYGAYVIVVDISRANDVWHATDIHTMATISGTKPVAILDVDDKIVMWENK